MSRPRAKSNVKRFGRQPSALDQLNGQAVRPRGIQRKQSLTQFRKSARLEEKQRLLRQLESPEQVHQLPSPTTNTPGKDARSTILPLRGNVRLTKSQKFPRDSSVLVRPSNSDRKRKRSPESSQNCKTEGGEVDQPLPPRNNEPGLKRRRTQPASYAVKDTSSKAAVSSISNSNQYLHHWAQEGSWPPEYFEQDSNMSQPLTRKRSTPSLSNEQPETSASSREGKNPAAKSRRYEQILASVGIYMDDNDEVATTETCRALCQTLLDTKQIIPQDSLFNDDLFRRISQRVRNSNEARVIRDLSPLLVPSAEILHVRGATHLKHLIENVDEGWIKSIPLVNGPRPHPDFSVGLKSSAFTSDQLKKLKPFFGEWQTTSRVVATDEMYFPFLTSEVKCGNEALNIADRQNAHSASVAANAVVEIYRAVSRQDELHRQILTFSISHDNEAVRIYGHYALINGQDTSFYRHPIKKFDFTSEDGKEKWTAYKFTRNLYDIFLPIHIERICAAVDQLPNPEAFLVKPLSQQSNSESFEPDDSQMTASYSQETEPRLPSSQSSEPVYEKPKEKDAGE